MTIITAKAKVSGLHPASGKYLTAGEQYEIDDSIFSEEVFEAPQAFAGSAAARELPGTSTLNDTPETETQPDPAPAAPAAKSEGGES